MQKRHIMSIVLLLVSSLLVSATADVKEVTDDTSIPFSEYMAQQAKAAIGDDSSVWISYKLTVRPSMADITIDYKYDGNYYTRHGRNYSKEDGIIVRHSPDKRVLLRFNKDDFITPTALRVVDESESISFTSAAIEIEGVSKERSLSMVRNRMDKDAAVKQTWMALLAMHPGNEVSQLLLDTYKTSDQDAKKQALFWYSETLEGEDLGELPSLYSRASDSLKNHFTFIYYNLKSKAGFDRLVGIVKDEDNADTVEKAVFWIGQSERAEALTVLKNLYATRSESNLKEKIIFAISQHDSEDSAQYLQDLARSEANSELRSKAVFWLGQREGAEALELLSELYASEKTPNVQEKIIFSISQMDTPESLEWLRSVAEKDSSEKNRERAIFWIGQHGKEDQAARMLKDLYNSQESDELKEKIIFSISQTDSPEMESFLEQLIRNERSVGLRGKALFWLSQSGDEGQTVELLSSLYPEEKSREIKEKIIFNLSQIGLSKARGMLKQIAESDTDSDMRKKALYWLTQSGGDEAAEILEDTLLKK